MNAFIQAFAQLPEPSLRRVLFKGLVGALAVFVLLWFGIDFLLGSTQLFSWKWLETLADLGGKIAVVVLLFVLFPSVSTIIVSFFLEEAAVAVEAKHYPNLGPARAQPISEILAITLKFTVLAVVLNLLILPIYLLLLFVPPLNLFVFYLLNGYLLGREYYELVAHRRIDPPIARQLRKRVRWQVLLSGAIITFLMTIPIVNLVAPIVATAAMVHLVEGWRGRIKMAEAQ